MAPLTGIAFTSNWLISKLNLNSFSVKTTRMTTNFYVNGLHEPVRWSDVKGRLNREMKVTFGCEDYVYEELIAELGSAFLMADLGIVEEVQHEILLPS